MIGWLRRRSVFTRRRVSTERPPLIEEHRPLWALIQKSVFCVPKWHRCAEKELHRMSGLPFRLRSLAEEHVSWLWRCWRCEARRRDCPQCGAWRRSPWRPAAPCPCPAAAGRTPDTASGSGRGAARRTAWCRSLLCTAASEACFRRPPGPASRTETAARWTAPEDTEDSVNAGGTALSLGPAIDAVLFLFLARLYPDLCQLDKAKVWLYKISWNLI